LLASLDFLRDFSDFRQTDGSLNKLPFFRKGYVMTKEINEYMDYVKKQLEDGKITREFLEMFLTRIKFYQHERLIHLIVTMTFAIMTVIAVFMLILGAETAGVLLSILFLCLTVPYVMHYYFLENSVQALYKLYYKAAEKLDE